MRTQKYYIVFIFVLITGLFFQNNVNAEVYVNMLWDDQLETFRVQPLMLDGTGVTLNRDYQNAYGTMLNLDPGPPFIIQSSIYANNINEPDGTVINWGSITIESGGIGFLEPFNIYLNPSPGHETTIFCDGSLKIIGNPLDPIKIEGVLEIKAGHTGGPDPDGNGSHEHIFQNVEFSYPVYDQTTFNPYPIIFQGGDVTLDHCQFEGFNSSFGYVLSFNDVYNVVNRPVWSYTMNQCRFENNSTNMHPISLSNLKSVELTGNHFVNNTFFTNGLDGVMQIDECGLKSIKNNTGDNNSNNIIRIIEPWVSDSAQIQNDETLVLVSTAIEVPKDSTLVIGPGALMKFYQLTGGIINRGNLIIESAILTSHQDDKYGGDTDMEPPPTWIARWNAGSGYSAGIFIDTTGTAEINSSIIRYAEGAVHALNDVTINASRFQYSNGFGLWFAGYHSDSFEVYNTIIENTTTSGYVADYGVMLDNYNGQEQTLLMDKVTIWNGDNHGIYIQSPFNNPVIARITNSWIINNQYNGIYANISAGIDSLQISNCHVVANGAAGIQCVDGGGDDAVIEIDNCFVAGNGEITTPRNGVQISTGIAKLIGNTIAFNNQAGASFSQLNEAQSSAINNIFYHNGYYGYSMGDYSMPVFSHNVLWDNDENVYEIYFRTPDGVVRTVEEVQALGGDYATNQHADPGFYQQLTGTVDSVVYDTLSEVTRLYAPAGTFNGRILSPGAIMPDTTEPSWFYIAGNTEDYIIFRGDASTIASPGDIYLIFDPHLSNTSNLIDIGNTTASRRIYDLDGEDRVIDGDENGTAYVDIGADEYNPLAGLPFVEIIDPSDGELILADTDYDILWNQDSLETINILFTDDTELQNWDTLAKEIDASEFAYTWKTPNIASLKCQLRLVSATDPNILDTTLHFGIKGYQLSSIMLDSLLDIYIQLITPHRIYGPQHGIINLITPEGPTL